MSEQKTENISSVPIDGFSNLRITSIWTFLASVSWNFTLLNRHANKLSLALAVTQVVFFLAVCYCCGLQVQWSEPWLVGLLAFHGVCLFLTLITCRFYRAQICHFLLIGNVFKFFRQKHRLTGFPHCQSGTKQARQCCFNLVGRLVKWLVWKIILDID